MVEISAHESKNKSFVNQIRQDEIVVPVDNSSYTSSVSSTVRAFQKPLRVNTGF